MQNYNLAWNKSFFTLSIALGAYLFSCQSKNSSEVIWKIDIPVIGSQSSPRAVDLNRDGILDMVIGAGKNEFQYSDLGILALDGRDGKILWSHESEDQVYGAATFLDINIDGIDDVVIGGRGPHLRAIDGSNGSLLWKYDFQFENHPILQYARYNFNTCALIPDLTGDGIQEILAVNGGNAVAEPYENVDRYPGVMMVINPVNGEIIVADTMPDGKESYMSPLYLENHLNNTNYILFGTGGETISGNLYLGTLEDLLEQQLSRSKIIAMEEGHGFISTPVLADINKDGILDIVAISHASTALAIDGNTKKVIWRNTVPETECSNSFSVGYFNKDDIPDFFTFVSKGVWPENSGSIQVLFDGLTGEILYKESMGCSGFSSPVVYDLNKDGVDEAIISINEFDCNRKMDDRSFFSIENKLIAIDFKNDRIWPIDQTKGMKNIFSTPWIGDLDADGFLDIVHCQYFSHSDILSFLGMRIKRIDTPIKIKQPVIWGAYLGSHYDGVYKRKK
ncbi:PQQ-binding-like beta-propeller repeat protein [Cecembia rubra]|uniref:outer membrane protein assembly factor BamB family protein n=1 Tax=Cecembia rubra TaxID=1485585 RepID=UPI00271535BA|nr:PQQ-binding-like beta-propeller repeat protein [Cecembia rubra]